MGATTKNPSGIAYGAAVTVPSKALASMAAGADLGTAADPYVLMICPKPTRVHGGRLVARGTPTGIDGSNTVVVALRKIDELGAVSGTICSHTISANPAAVGKLPPSVNINGSNNLDPTYQDIPAGGGIGIYITQGATADLHATAVVDAILSLSTADDSNLSN